MGEFARGLSRKLPYSVVPYALWLLFLYVPALLMMVIYSFWQSSYVRVIKTWSFENYRVILLERPVYFLILGRTLLLAVSVVAVTFLLAYPLAYFLAKRVRSERLRTYLLVVMVLPFLTGYLIRTLAWTGILGRNGVVNSLLMGVGVIREPMDFLLYGWFAVFVSLVYNNLSFMFFPIYLSLSSLDDRLVQAAADLGAGPQRTFWRVVLPLSMPGVLAGTILTFIPVVASVVEPQLLGGTAGRLFGNLVSSQFTLAFNWPLGSALSILLVGTLVVALVLYTAVIAVRFRLGRQL